MVRMFILTPQQALLIGFIVAPSLFALCAHFTRANVRRITGALVGAQLIAPLTTFGIRRHFASAAVFFVIISCVMYKYGEGYFEVIQRATERLKPEK